MIFLAISGILAGSAIALISGKLGNTEFNQGIYQIQNELESQISNVSTGLYQETGSQQFKCLESGGIISITSAASVTVGANIGCQYLGEAIQFAPGNDTSEYTIIPVAGAQSATVPTLATAAPCAIYPGTYAGNCSSYNASMTESLPYGFTVGGAGVGKTAIASTSPNTFLFLTSDVANDSSDATGRGVDLVPIKTTTLSTLNDAAYDIHAYPTGYDLTAYNDPVWVCFNGPAKTQSAVVTIGGDGNSSDVALITQKGACP
jgi:hypothetical protein